MNKPRKGAVLTKKTFKKELAKAALSISRIKELVSDVEEIMDDAVSGKLEARRSGLKSMKQIEILAKSGRQAFKDTDPWYRQNVAKCRAKKKDQDKPEQQ